MESNYKKKNKKVKYFILNPRAQSVAKALFTLLIALLLSYECVAQDVTYHLKETDVEISNDGIITKCNKFDYNWLTIPATIGGRTIKGIGKKVFSDRTNINYLVLEQGIESVGDSAFANIGIINTTFSTSGLILPASLKTVGDFAFDHSMVNDTKSLTLPANILTLGKKAFANNNITGIEFTEPSRIEKIGAGAFSSNALNSPVKFPARATDDTEFLEYRDNLGNKYNIGDNIPDFSLEYYAYKGDYTLKLADVVIVNGVITSCSYDFKKTDIIIPGTIGNITITGIGKSVFERKSLTSVKLPEGLNTIADLAFSYSSLVGTLTLPTTITSIGKGAFDNTRFNGQLILPKGLTTIEDNAFNGNLFSGTLDLPAGITSIGDNAFASCKFNGQLKLPAGLTSIGNRAFSGNSFSGTLEIPASITSIGGWVFQNGNDFSSVVFVGPSKIEEIGVYTFDGISKLNYINLPKRTKEKNWFHWKNSNGEDLGASPTITNFSSSYTAEFKEQIKVTWESVIGGKVVFDPLPREVSDNYVTFDVNTQIKFTAVPNAGYTFSKFVIDGADHTASEYSLTTTTADISAKAIFARATVTNPVKLTIAIDGKGEVQGQGISLGDNFFSKDTPVSFSAKEVPGYRFDRWVIGMQTDKKKDQSITLTANITLTAYFIKQASLTIFKNPDWGGEYTVTPAPNALGTYDINTEVKLNATSSTDYRFDRWVIGTQQNTNPEQSVTLTADQTFVTANFVKQVTLTKTVVPVAGGSYAVTPAPNALGTYDINTKVTLTPTPATGYGFDHWEAGGTTDYNNVQEITLTVDTEVKAIFKILAATVTLEVKVMGEGTVTPQGISNYESGTSVTLKATPATGYRFARWEVGTQRYDNNEQSIRLEANTTATAYFIQQVTLSITVPDAGGGYTVTPAPNVVLRTYDIKTVVTLTATANMGYRFDRWVVGPQQYTNMMQSITLEASTSVSVYFIKQVKLTQTSVPTEGGRYVVTPMPNEVTGTYDVGTEINLQAISAKGYRFNKWDVAGEENLDQKIELTLTENIEVVTHFIKQVTLTKIPVPAGQGGYSVIPDLGTYDIYTAVTLTATPATGYGFDRWEVGGSTYNNRIQEVKLANNTQLSVYFKTLTDPVTLEVKAKGEGTVTPKGIDNYEREYVVTLKAVPASGYRFDRWEVVAINVGAINYNLMEKEIMLKETSTVATAYFIRQVTLTKTAVPAEQGSYTVTPDLATYDINAKVTLSATPTADHVFDSWDVDGTTLYNIIHEITLADNTIVTVYFRTLVDPVILEVKVMGEGKVTPQGINFYERNKIVTLAATPATGNVFDRWEVGGTTYNKSVQEITLTDNTVATANFKKAEAPVLAIEDIENHSVSYYPNPIYDRLTVVTEGIASVMLRSADGRAVYQSLQNGNSTVDIDVSALPSGIYFLQLIKADGSASTSKILKN